MISFHLVSLGCAKNLVDSEVVLGCLAASGMQFVEDPEKADVLLLNTCGFIQPAVEEAIEEILFLAEIKERRPPKKLVVFGCLVQRYKGKLLEELPEVDLFLGTESFRDIGLRIKELVHGSSPSPLDLPDRTLMDSSLPRILTTPSFRAWLKITEGCSNRCSYCMIPSIRGDLRSRSSVDLVKEAQLLESRGIKELSLIAQDLTAYGNDLGDERLVSLLEKLLRETSIPWLRLLYLYPTGISEDLLALMAGQPRLLPYLDIPFQHASSRILSAMNRRHSGEDLYRLVEKIRGYLPGVALRTTFMVGFPGETEADVRLIEDMLQALRLDHVGVFAYTNEEGSSSEHFAGQCSDDEKEERKARILSMQAGLSEEIQRKYLGKTELVLVEGVSAETDLLLEGRTRFQAPEIDGCVYINEGTASPGDLVMVEISETQTYDLVGAIID